MLARPASSNRSEISPQFSHGHPLPRGALDCIFAASIPTYKIRQAGDFVKETVKYCATLPIVDVKENLSL